ncbi:MAG: hypothetical protein H0S84_07095 [Bacteroidales bacterium]|nr:hypothetical protein [Bacteroidales bacterium]
MDKLAKLTQTLIKRWTAKSPKMYRTVTDVSVAVAFTATLLPLLPLSVPAWLVPLGAYIVALSAKLTIDKPNKP